MCVYWLRSHCSWARARRRRPTSGRVGFALPAAGGGLMAESAVRLVWLERPRGRRPDPARGRSSPTGPENRFNDAAVRRLRAAVGRHDVDGRASRAPPPCTKYTARQHAGDRDREEARLQRPGLEPRRDAPVLHRFHDPARGRDRLLPPTTGSDDTDGRSRAIDPADGLPDGPVRRCRRTACGSHCSAAERSAVTGPDGNARGSNVR